MLVEVYSIVGFPRVVITDNGPEFANALFEQVSITAGFEWRPTTAYNPRANGFAEARVKIAKGLILRLAYGDLVHWDKYRIPAQIAMNNRIASRTQTRYFTLFHAREPTSFTGTDFKLTGYEDLAEEDLVRRWDVVQRLVFPAIKETERKYLERIQKKHAKKKHLVDPFLPNQKVLVKDPKAGKKDERWEGPYLVVRRNRGGAYIISTGNGQLFPRNVPAHHLKPAGPDHRDMDERYVVQSIIGHRRVKSGMEFRVSWKGFSNKSDSWVPAKNFDSTDLIRTYFNRRFGRKSERTKEVRELAKLAGYNTTHHNSDDLSMTPINTTGTNGSLHDKVDGPCAEPLQHASARQEGDPNATRCSTKRSRRSHRSGVAAGDPDNSSDIPSMSGEGDGTPSVPSGDCGSDHGDANDCNRHSAQCSNTEDGGRPPERRSARRRMSTTVF